MVQVVPWIIVGIMAGLLAKLLFPGDNPAGTYGDLVAGICGAFIGGSLFTALVGTNLSGWIVSSLIALMFAMVMLFMIRAVNGRNERSRH